MHMGGCQAWSMVLAATVCRYHSTDLPLYSLAPALAFLSQYEKELWSLSRPRWCSWQRGHKRLAPVTVCEWRMGESWKITVLLLCLGRQGVLRS